MLITVTTINAMGRTVLPSNVLVFRVALAIGPVR